MLYWNTQISQKFTSLSIRSQRQRRNTDLIVADSPFENIQRFISSCLYWFRYIWSFKKEMPSLPYNTCNPSYVLHWKGRLHVLCVQWLVKNNWPKRHPRYLEKYVLCFKVFPNNSFSSSEENWKCPEMFRMSLNYRNFAICIW